MIFQLFRRPANHVLIDRLRGEIVAAARDPVLYRDYGIEDGLEGRFETLTLHAALVLRRLNRMPPPAPEMAQDLTDSLFRYFDSAIRETGVGDSGLRKRMRSIAEAFLGRAAAYDNALNMGMPAIAAALARNVYDGRGEPGRLCALSGGRKPPIGSSVPRGFHPWPGSVSPARGHCLENPIC